MSAIYTLGIDVGSTASKCIMLKDGQEIVAKSLIDVGAGTSGPGKDHFLCAFCDVQAVFIAETVLHSVRCDGSGTSNIEDSDLAALKEIVGTEVFPAVDPLFDGDMFFHRHAAQCHHAVHMGVYGYHLIRMVEILNQELISKFFGCVAFYVSLICGITNIHMFFTPYLYSERFLCRPG